MERIVTYVQHANILRIALAAIALTSTPALGQSQASPRPKLEPPADITPLYGNTVELKIGRATGLTGSPAIQRRYYFTADGNRVLTTVLGPEDHADGSYSGVTFGREEKTCIEPNQSFTGAQSIVCGTMMVRQNIVTLIHETQRWNTALRYADGNRLETVFSFNGRGQCSFIWEEKRDTGATSRASSPGERNVGTCRILDGRHMDRPQLTILE